MSEEQPTSTDRQERRPSRFVRREDYKPMMIRVSGLKISLDDFKEKISNRVSVAQEGNDFCMLTSSKYWLEQAKLQFPDATYEIVDSVVSVYQNSLKIQTALNWNKFRKLNAEYVADKEAEVFVVIHSSPFEASKPELAEKFARSVASLAYFTESSHELIAVVRPWLIETFKNLKADESFTDMHGKKIDKFYYYINRTPMERPRDKAIGVKVYMKVADVNEMVAGFEKLEHFPQVMFLNPTTMGERKPNRRNLRDRRDNRTERRREGKEGEERREPRRYDNERPRRNDDRPRDGDHQRRSDDRPRRYEDRPARDGDERREPRKYDTERPRRYEDRPRRNDDHPRDGDRREPRKYDSERKPHQEGGSDIIEIGKESSSRFDTFVLEGVPESMDVSQLSKSLTTALGKEVHVRKMNGVIICTVLPDFAEKLQGILDRLKINGVQITYTKK